MKTNYRNSDYYWCAALPHILYLQQQTYKLEIAMDAAVESFISFTLQ